MIYDTIIIGSGPAGLTASIYASRYRLSNLVIGKLVGGTITYASEVSNFPGLSAISGTELGRKMAEQAKNLGAEILTEGVGKIERIGTEGREFKVATEGRKELLTKTLIVATGTERRKLGVPGETEYLGKGVSYCTTCDAPFFKGKTVVLVGGSNAACSGALHLADFAEKIYLIYRKSQLRAEPVWVEEVKKNPKIEVLYETNITKILGGSAFAEASAGSQEGQEGTGGQGRITAVELDNPYNGEKFLKTDGVFIEIGGIPAGEMLKLLGVEFNEDGYVKVSEKMETNIPGVFAAGDVTDKSLILSQAITACAQGAIAANSAFEYLRSRIKI